MACGSLERVNTHVEKWRQATHDGKQPQCAITTTLVVVGFLSLVIVPFGLQIPTALGVISLHPGWVAVGLGTGGLLFALGAWLTPKEYRPPRGVIVISGLCGLFLMGWGVAGVGGLLSSQTVWAGVSAVKWIGTLGMLGVCCCYCCCCD